MGILKRIKRWFSLYRRMSEAEKYGVPFRDREWYNYMAMIPKAERKEYSFIEIFDANGKYVACPSVGGEVILNNKGERYVYEVVGFKNDSPMSDWLYDGDWINPIIEYLRKADKEG